MRHHSGPRGAAAGADWSYSDEDAEDAAGSPGQDIRHALGLGQQEPRVRQPGRQADRVGLVLDQQSARHSPAVLLGHDLRLRPQWQLRGLRVRYSHEYWSTHHEHRLLSLVSHFVHLDMIILHITRVIIKPAEWLMGVIFRGLDNICSIYSLKTREGNVRVSRELPGHTG